MTVASTATVVSGSLAKRLELVVGAPGSPLAAWVASRLRNAVACGGLNARVVLAESDDLAVKSLASHTASAARALLCQDRPGQLPPSLPDQLRQACPGVSLLSIAGSWCEGELRTGKPWEGVPRVYWHDFEATQVYGAAASARQATANRLAVGVDCVDIDTYQALTDALQPAGFNAVWLPRFGRRPLASPADLGLWVGGQLGGLASARLAGFAAAMRDQAAATIALLDFPRHDEARLAARLGVAAVVGKPWDADRLCETLRSAATLAEKRHRSRFNGPPLVVRRAA